eukprot:6313618-Heterocapsa_arctica.AAC.1
MAAAIKARADYGVRVNGQKNSGEGPPDQHAWKEVVTAAIAVAKNMPNLKAALDNLEQHFAATDREQSLRELLSC